LQGKTQLYPGAHSDFFRNRLTHSLEVAQIAKSIAIRVNALCPIFSKTDDSEPIDLDLVETAALAHDLGHPPFGHNGEDALNECMRSAGGFEGNAQTLRILARLEKRQTKPTTSGNVQQAVLGGKDNRAGLNLTYRTLASVLKYDFKIPHNLPAGKTPGSFKVEKGYYYTEEDLVAEIKKRVDSGGKPFRTVECNIMDVADDIAYSTYDLEDSFKAGFLSPLSMLTTSDKVKSEVANEIKKRLNKYYPDYSEKDREFTVDDVDRHLVGTLSNVFTTAEADVSAEDFAKDPANAGIVIATHLAEASEKTATSGYYRTRFTSDLVGEFVRSIKIDENPTNPAFTIVRLEIEAFKRVEVLKNLAFQSLIMSSRLKVAEHRGKQIVHRIFQALKEGEGWHLLPEDFQALFEQFTDPAEKQRVICDFIAGMTDRYAVQFYGRLEGTNPESIFSPL
jgi:dGTPase